MMRLFFKDLLIWQKGIDLVDTVYTVTEQFPRSEEFGLKSQSRRSAVSIPSNIAEGSQRSSDKEFANYILIAKGSLAELHTQMIIAKRHNLLSATFEEKIFLQIDELHKMLYAFHRKLTANR